MLGLFARWWDSRRRSEPRIRSARARAAARSRSRARRSSRPVGEAFDSRLLMASGNPALSEVVAQALQPYLSQDQIPGISVAIVTNGQVALAQGYGVSNVANTSPVQPDTRFDIGSVTKTFTALGVLLLYQQSQGTAHALNLNAPISEYLHNTPAFKLPRKWAAVTTMELLNMSSGIRDVGGSQTWEAQLKSIANAPLLYTPGTESSYSSANYDLLGELIQQWTGQKYGAFLHDRILTPLGMSESQLLGQSATVPGQAVGYAPPRHGRWPKAEVQNGPAMFAAAGMVSTAEDMATYMTALLGGRLLNPTTYALMWTSIPTIQYGAGPAANAIPGLGWDTAIDTDTGISEVAKSGQVPGYNSELILYPSSDSGIFISFNTNYYGSRNPNGITALQVAEAVYTATQTLSTND